MTPIPLTDEHATDVVLRDGTTLRLRQIRPDDAPGLVDLFSRMSERSLYYRFLGIRHVDLPQATRMTAVNPLRECVIVGESGPRLVAIAGYYGTTDRPDAAEVAFAIADDQHGRGIGTRMLERLAEIGRARGLSAFEALVHGDNRPMMDVFLDSGFQASKVISDGVFNVRLSLDPTPAFLERAADRAQQAAARSMRPFFEPRAVAVIGANRQRGRIGSEILHNLVESGYTGRLVPVHPSADAIDGLAAYPSLDAIPFAIDLAVVVVPAADVPGAVDACIAKGVKALVIISAGFSETDAAGKALEAGLVEKIRAAGIRMIGPNCMGIINTNPAFNLNATFSPIYPPAGRVAFSTQSGALGLAILDYVRQLNLGISTFASIGNKADVSGNDLIQYWADDDRTDVILLYLESFGNPRKFGEIARRVGRRKPIVAVKAGRSTAGSRAASSHTGARATSDTLVDTLLRQAGVIRTHTLEELFDVASLLAHQPVPAGRRVAIVTNAGGPGILAADACEANGLELPRLSTETEARLREFLPAAASVANPVDMIASATPGHYRRAIEIVLADPAVDSLLVIFIPPLVTQAAEVAEAIAEATAATGKTVLATFMGGRGAAPVPSVPSYQFPESAAVALARVAQYGQWLRQPQAEPPVLPAFHRDVVRSIVERALAAGGGWLSPADAFGLLEACGITVADWRYVHTADEAVEAARAIGYPVVLKAVGGSVLHKTEIGGVRLDVTGDEAVRTGFRELMSRLDDRLHGVLVQRMAARGVEMVAGAINDPAFGPLVMAGTGGIFVELAADTVFRLCPLTRGEAAEMVAETKGRALLGGYRGAPPADQVAFEYVLLAVSQLADACPEIHELDINPVIVQPHGAVAVDVRVRVGPKSPPAAGRRIAY